MNHSPWNEAFFFCLSYDDCTTLHYLLSTLAATSLVRVSWHDVPYSVPLSISACLTVYWFSPYLAKSTTQMPPYVNHLGNSWTIWRGSWWMPELQRRFCPQISASLASVDIISKFYIVQLQCNIMQLQRNIVQLQCKCHYSFYLELVFITPDFSCMPHEIFSTYKPNHIKGMWQCISQPCYSSLRAQILTGPVISWYFQ